MNALVETLDTTVSDLLSALDAHPAARRLLAGDLDTDEYAAFLGQTYLYVRQTRPLLRRAGERLARAGKALDLARLFLQKADEEQGHDLWVLEDLAAIGRAQSPAAPPRPSPAVTAYIAWNQFQVEAGSPLAFLGTAYILEALSQARAGTTAAHLVARRRIPGIERGVRFLRGHADADEGHTSVLRGLFARLEAEGDRRAITLSAAVTAALYLGMFAGDASTVNAAATPGE
ncbi:iron-containing redox enzyme family protein [Polyangium mundeleinium]|uniref:Iron-containing redox enzyme family protein n=1 Tax=Polyangium mundeleinium TaxID=2995306 RepID=A0ABT5EKT6_9BACT|nr:iron-containing redox enzyme family protein [Polyangium mundeleinium]MDC0742438.1 iron-containing redox enzyme family protein [Polyangium mundeleinium]